MTSGFIGKLFSLIVVVAGVTAAQSASTAQRPAQQEHDDLFLKLGGLPVQSVQQTPPKGDCFFLKLGGRPVRSASNEGDLYTVIKETRGSKPTWTVMYSQHSASGKNPSSPSLKYTVQFLENCDSKDLNEYDCDHPLVVGQTFGIYDIPSAGEASGTMVDVADRWGLFSIIELRGEGGNKCVTHSYKIVRVEVEKDSAGASTQTSSPRKDIPSIAKAANDRGETPAKISDAFAKAEVLALQAIEIEKEDSTLVRRPDGSFITRSEAALDVARAEAVSSQEKLISSLVEKIYEHKVVSDYPLEVLEKSPTLEKDVKGFSSRINACISAEKDALRRRSAEVPKVCNDEVISPPKTKEELAALQRKINAEVQAGQPRSQSAPPRKDIPSIAKAANGAIVTIVTAAGDKPIAQGTGFVVSADGAIVTNYHVIKEGSTAIVKFSDGTVLPVDGVLAADKVRDLAIIKIHGKTLRTLTLGNSDRVQVGEEVVAIGNPLGLELTVSNGILSGLRADKEAGGKFLQTTAPISPGSSGGPLFNMAGEVVGITTMYLKGGENLNFAIPINEARRLLEDSSTKLSPLPNEPERAESNTQAHTEQAAPVRLPSGPRDYYQQLFDAGAFFITGPNGSKLRNVDYACFNDDPAWEQFFTLVLRGGGRIAEETVYDKGVKFFAREYHGEGNSYVLSIPPTDPKAYTRTSRTLNLSVEPTTMRYIESTTETITVGWGDTAATDTTRYGPWGGICKKVAGDALPPNMKIAATSPDDSGTQEQRWEDITYCYKNPANSLLSNGKIVSCGEINTSIEAREKECKSKGPKTNPENCKGFLKSIKDLKVGRL